VGERGERGEHLEGGAGVPRTGLRRRASPAPFEGKVVLVLLQGSFSEEGAPSKEERDLRSSTRPESFLSARTWAFSSNNRLRWL